jgi:hypothetical protein
MYSTEAFTENNNTAKKEMKRQVRIKKSSKETSEAHSKRSIGGLL